MNIESKFFRGSIVVFYLLIGLEIVIMISPFAAYFYAGYGPLLNVLYALPATAWLTGFFLPHAAISKSSLLNFLNEFGRTLFSLGLVAFLVGAVQIYSAKLRKKGVVTGILYRWIRHPQYLFLAIAGLGLLLFWPRFFILVLYVSMLFVYYLLARHEERRMLDQYGEGYQAYIERTAIFLPGEPGGKIFKTLFGWSKSRGFGLALAYGGALALSIAVAFGLRSYTISQTSLWINPEKRILAVSVLPRPEKSMQSIVDVAYQDSTVRAALDRFREKGHKAFMVHIMPQHYMMQALFAQPDMSGMRMRSGGRTWLGVLGFLFPFFTGHSHHQMMGATDGGPVRLIFSQLTWPNGKYASYDKGLAFTVKHLPLLRVDIDKGKIFRVERTPPRNFWGQMPMPVF